MSIPSPPWIYIYIYIYIYFLKIHIHMYLVLVRRTTKWMAIDKTILLVIVIFSTGNSQKYDFTAGSQ